MSKTDLNFVEVTDELIAEALQRPSDFGYHGDNAELFLTWSLGPVIEHRDSDLLAKSNAEILKKELESAEEKGVIEPNSWAIESCNHSAVGWVDHLSFKVVDEKREPTNVFKFTVSWFEGLQEYPVADDEHYSELQYNAAIDCISCNCPDVPAGFVLPEDWSSQIYRDLGDNEVYPDEDGCVASEKIEEAFARLGWLGCSHCEGDGWHYDLDAKQLIIPALDIEGKEWEFLQVS